MIPFSGQLGVGALGKFELGTIAVFGTFVPHRGRARSALSADTASASVRRTGIGSAVSGATARSTIRRGPGARSSVTARTISSEVDDGG